MGLIQHNPHSEDCFYNQDSITGILSIHPSYHTMQNCCLVIMHSCFQKHYDIVIRLQMTKMDCFCSLVLFCSLDEVLVCTMGWTHVVKDPEVDDQTVLPLKHWQKGTLNFATMHANFIAHAIAVISSVLSYLNKFLFSWLSDKHELTPDNLIISYDLIYPTALIHIILIFKQEYWESHSACKMNLWEWHPWLV